MNEFLLLAVLMIYLAIRYESPTPKTTAPQRVDTESDKRA
jgi:hypothetical protein